MMSLLPCYISMLLVLPVQIHWDICTHFVTNLQDDFLLLGPNQWCRWYLAIFLCFISVSCNSLDQCLAIFLSDGIFAHISSPILTPWMPTSTPIYNMYIIWAQISISANEIQHSANWWNAPLSRFEPVMSEDVRCAHISMRAQSILLVEICTFISGLCTHLEFRKFTHILQMQRHWTPLIRFGNINSWFIFEFMSYNIQIGKRHGYYAVDLLFKWFAHTYFVLRFWFHWSTSNVYPVSVHPLWGFLELFLKCFSIPPFGFRPNENIRKSMNTVICFLLDSNNYLIQIAHLKKLPKPTNGPI